MKEILKMIKNKDMVYYTLQVEKNGQVNLQKIFQMDLAHFLVNQVK